MRSRRSVTRFGGIGVMVLTVGVGIMAGAGIVLTTLGDITRVPGAAGMVATGVVGMVVAIGDIITIGTAVLAGAGVVEAIGHATLTTGRRSYAPSRYSSSTSRRSDYGRS